MENNNNNPKGSTTTTSSTSTAINNKPSKSKIELVKALKEDGNKDFRIGYFDLCLRSYEEAVSLLNEEVTHIEYLPLMKSLSTNIAVCKQKMGLFIESIPNCNKSIELDPTYVKAYFLRGKAYLQDEKLELAAMDFQTALSQNPTEQEKVDIKKQIELADEKIAHERKRALKNISIKQRVPTNLTPPTKPSSSSSSSKIHSVEKHLLPTHLLPPSLHLKISLDLYLIIFGFLNLTSLLKCSLVCKIWKTFVGNSLLWTKNFSNESNIIEFPKKPRKTHFESFSTVVGNFLNVDTSNLEEEDDGDDDEEDYVTQSKPNSIKIWHPPSNVISCSDMRRCRTQRFQIARSLKGSCSRENICTHMPLSNSPSFSLSRNLRYLSFITGYQTVECFDVKLQKSLTICKLKTEGALIKAKIVLVKAGDISVVCAFSDGKIEVYNANLFAGEFHHGEGTQVLWIEITDTDHTILTFGNDRILKVWSHEPPSPLWTCVKCIVVPIDITSLHFSCGFILGFGKSRVLSWDLRLVFKSESKEIEYDVCQPWSGHDLRNLQCLKDFRVIVGLRNNYDIVLWTFNPSEIVANRLVIQCFCTIKVPLKGISFFVNMVDHLVLCNCGESIFIIDICTGAILRQVGFPMASIVKVWWSKGTIYTIMGTGNVMISETPLRSHPELPQLSLSGTMVSAKFGV